MPNLFKRAIRAGLHEFRDKNSLIPYWRIENSELGPRIKGTALLVKNVEQFPFLANSFALDLITKLSQRKKIIINATDEGLFFTVDDIKLKIETREELFIIDEVFVSRCYDVTTCSQSVIIDIGMNVGFASLWYANRADVVAVYGYEPFPSTFAQAKINISLNPKLESKIHCTNVGIGRVTQSLRLPYDPDRKGLSNMHGIPTDNRKQSELQTEQVQVCSIADSLQNVIANNCQYDLVAKIDCEGSEYDIIPALSELGYLGNFKAISLEWHYHGPEKLTSILKQNGFSIIRLDTNSPRAGMIYAVK